MSTGNPRWQFRLKTLVWLTTFLSVVLGLAGWIGYSFAAEILGALTVIGFVAAVPLAILLALIMILIYAPADPLRRDSSRRPPPHQFDAREHG